MEQVVVVHKKSPRRGYTVEYIGRPRTLGNPYPMQDATAKERKWVIDQYRAWLREQWTAGGAVRAALEVLAERVRDGECIALECYCAPKACHGDVIKEAIEGINRRHDARLLEKST